PEELVLIEHEVTRRRIYASIPFEQRRLWHEQIYKRAMHEWHTSQFFAARHALAAKLYDRAADLFLSEARKHYESGNCITANVCFEKATRALRLDDRNLSPDDEILYAISLERTGNITEAHRIAHALKATPAVQKDS